MQKSKKETHEPVAKVKDFIRNKDYDYIEWCATLPEDMGEEEIFIGIASSKNGKLVSLDGDCYSEDTEIIRYEEWSNPEKGIKNGLTVVFKGEWVNGQ